MENFTPWSALAGGVLLGLSAALLLVFTSKIAGISGIIGGLLTPRKNDLSWRVAFLIGMILSFLMVAPFGLSLPDSLSFPPMNNSIQSILLIAIAGLFVGFGTRLGNGCTSGHGIIGIGRFSKRSIVATFTFIVSAMLVVYLRKFFGAL